MNPHFWRGKRVLLTGHTGFKGGWAAIWLSQIGAQVTGLALPPDQTPSLFQLGSDFGNANLRPESATYLRSFAIELSAANRQAIYVPAALVALRVAVVGLQAAGLSLRTTLRLTLPLAALSLLVLVPLDYGWWQLIGYLRH